MLKPISKSPMNEGIDRHSNLFYYPFDYAKSKEKAEFIIVTSCRLDEDALPIGTYYLNYVPPCNCPRIDKKNLILRLLRRIQSLFTKKIHKEICQFHSGNFDVYLRSNKRLFTWV